MNPSARQGSRPAVAKFALRQRSLSAALSSRRLFLSNLIVFWTVGKSQDRALDDFLSVISKDKKHQFVSNIPSETNKAPSNFLTLLRAWLLVCMASTTCNIPKHKAQQDAMRIKCASSPFHLHPLGARATAFQSFIPPCDAAQTEVLTTSSALGIAMETLSHALFAFVFVLVV